MVFRLQMSVESCAMAPKVFIVRVKDQNTVLFTPHGAPQHHFHQIAFPSTCCGGDQHMVSQHIRAVQIDFHLQNFGSASDIADIDRVGRSRKKAQVIIRDRLDVA